MVKRNRASQRQEEFPIEEQCKSLIKKLASCKQTIRDRSLRTVLRTWLPEQTEIPDEDMKKLWQGIFYCFWHADKSVYQSELIDRLCSALQSLPLPISLQYFTVFLFTMRREWSRIDRLRLDKFYLLIRRFLHGFFSLLDSNSWDLEFTRRLMVILFDGTFLAGDKFQGNGVNYHIASAFIEELRSFLPLRKEILELLFSPFVTTLGVVNDKILVGKIKSNLFEELLKMGKKLLDVKKSGKDAESEDSDEVVLGSIALSMEFAKRFYEMGSSPDCQQGNRKAIFALHKEFFQLEKDMTSFGIKVSITEASRPSDDEVPELVPMETEKDESNAVSEPKIVANESSSKKKSLKKCSDTKEEIVKKRKAQLDNIEADYDLTMKIASNTELVPVSMETENDESNTVSEPKIVANESSSKKKSLKKCSKTKKDSAKKKEYVSFEDEPIGEDVLENFRLAFEKIASDRQKAKDEIASGCKEAEPVPKAKKSKKRKRENKVKEQEQGTPVNKDAEAETTLTTPSTEKSSKRVKFAMKNNLVWKPNCPLPPQDLRLPPSATPRGSALKQGIPAGPVRELSFKRKTKKKTKPAVRRGVKMIKSFKKNSP